MKLPLTSLATLTSLLAATAVLAGCGGNDNETTTGNTTTTSTTEGGTSATGGSDGGGGSGGAAGSTDGGGGAGGDTQPQPQQLKTLSGDVTWQVTFDATAQAAGATDCSYTRHYEAVEDRSAQWLCPTCETMFLADVEVTAGLADCFSQITSSMPAKKEWIGYGNGMYFRGLGGPMTQQGTAAVDAASVQVANMVDAVEAPVGGTFSFDIAGTFTAGEKQGDPYNGFVPPATYTCGWPKANPPEYTGDYLLKKGGILPDGLFKDACGETVRLHDLKGSYMIVDMSAMDCPPCQAMAGEEEKFIQDMAAQGITVHVVTLLCPSLDNVIGETTQNMLKNWTSNFDLTAPVLADRGWGLSIFEPALGADQIGYPSWAIVDPDLVVLDFTTGFGGFGDAQSIILADAQ
jgi:AhpC/TSA family